MEVRIKTPVLLKRGPPGTPGAHFSLRNTTTTTLLPGEPATATLTPTGVPGQFDAAFGLPEGPPGRTAEALRYEHVQTSAANTWTVNHNLGKSPIIQVFDPSGAQIIGDISHPTASRTILTFSSAITGSAVFLA